MDQFEVQNFKGKKDRTARLLRLQILLWQHRNGIKISRLAQICSVSVRTIYRDLKTLESELKVPIWEEGAKRGVSEGYFLPPISFSIEEATIIFLSARMLQNYFQNYNLDLVSTFIKLNAAVPAPIKEQINNIVDNIKAHAYDRVLIRE